MCLKGEGIKELLKGWWMGYDFSVSPFHFGSKVESFEIRLENFETVERERERRKTLILIHVKCALTIEIYIYIYIYTRLGVLTTMHVTYINKER